MDKTERRIVNLQELLGTPEWETAKSEMKLPIPLGIDTYDAEQLTSADKFFFKTPTELINVQSN